MKKHDLILIHAPVVFDFRNRDDILFAYLSNSDAFSASPMCEIYPMAFKSIQTALRQQGKHVEIINLANLMLKNAELDVEGFLSTLDSKMFGIDLHWIAHAQGSLAVAKLLKKLHPLVPVMFGGLSSSLFYKDLIAYPQVDFVMRSNDTIFSVQQLIANLKDANYEDIPNLCWKDKSGQIIINEFKTGDKYLDYVDWSYSDPNINYYLVLPGAGCEYTCTFCGGSNYTMRKHYGMKQGFAEKPLDILLHELETIKNSPAKNKRIVTLHHWFENIDKLKKVLDTLKGGSIRTIHYTILNLISEDHIKLLAQHPMRPLFEISIESSSIEVRKACGKPPYTNQELEEWLDMAFALNKKTIIEISLMIGLPKQTPEMVMDDVAYATHLLQRYKEFDFNVYICPMRPFLDPQSAIYDNPEKFGYTLFFKTLMDYENAFLCPHWKDSLNFETKWMSREQFVDITYKACRELTLAKLNVEKLPAVLAKGVIERIDKTVDLLYSIKQYDKQSLPAHIREKILAYNQEILRSTVSQQKPLDFSVYKNWYE